MNSDPSIALENVPFMDSFWARHKDDFQEAGMTEEEVSRMSLDQKQSVLAILYESTGREWPPSSNDSSLPPTPELISQSRSPSHPGVLRLNVATFLRLPSYDETRRAECVLNYAALQELWRSVVEELAVFPAIDRIHYSQQIQAAVKELGPESPTGIVIALLLPNGMRITRTFGCDSPASMVYIVALLEWPPSSCPETATCRETNFCFGTQNLP
jgi:hypothetical protein